MKIALLGYGKMGKTIDELNTKNEIIYRITKERADFRDLFSKNRPDVIIEFTEPGSVLEHIYAAFDLEIPIVTGTTGWYDQMKEVRMACEKKNGSLFYASNFSIGANIFFYINKIAAGLINKHDSYSVKLSETHHATKKDTPSGTAITLANQIIGEMDRYIDWNIEDKMKNESLQIESKREGMVKGIHTAEFYSAEDSITITHEAHNRHGFALGALQAGEWLVGRKGIYTMDDMLNLNKSGI